MKNVVVPMEFSPTAYAMLKLLAVQAEHPSVDALIRSIIMVEVRAFAEALADKDDPTLAEIFAPEPKGRL